MRRRGVTVLIGIVLVGILTGSLLWVKVPYVALGPGPTVNTLGSYKDATIITIDGRESYNPKGQLRLVTVSVSPEISLLDAIYYWFDTDTAVVPRELVYPPDKSQKQVDNENAQQFQRSQSSAETAALSKLGYPVKVGVKEIVAGKPADGKLKAGDIITAVDGHAISGVPDVAPLIKAKPVGTSFVVDYTRDGVKGSVPVVSAANEKGEPAIGVSLEQAQPHPFKIDVKLGDIGGPSAGLMFTLGILAKLDATDLTGGVVIAGTGTMDDSGAVGPIGGIAQKLVGAKRDGAKFFLTPADNCAEAVKNAQPGLPLAKVKTLDDALAALAAIREHREPVLCGASDGK
ncbi:YlbL family protein [Longispora fulva]|uniref:YlbL family protein n=1 Tax=Longispora fulva TaxID=619741 RepID=UPI0018C96691|nr:PDZ domain-containing protein [Longispora fulva]